MQKKLHVRPDPLSELTKEQCKTTRPHTKSRCVLKSSLRSWLLNLFAGNNILVFNNDEFLRANVCLIQVSNYLLFFMFPIKEIISPLHPHRFVQSKIYNFSKY